MERSVPKASRSGFTLIEISIVLVIIGLIVGGVMVGRDLIQAAGVRSVTSQIEQFSISVNTFKTKYNCYPGDCPNPGNFGFTTAAGNGDGLIGTFSPVYGAQNACPENQLAWVALSEAKLIEGTYIALNTPITPVAGRHMPAVKGTIPPNQGWIFQPYNGKNYIYSGFTHMSHPPCTSYYSPLGAFTPAVAFAISTKIADGKPNSPRASATGRAPANSLNTWGYSVWNGSAWVANNVTLGTSNYNCFDPVANQYDFAVNNFTCNLFIAAQF